jgi:hypothetical protein
VNVSTLRRNRPDLAAAVSARWQVTRRTRGEEARVARLAELHAAIAALQAQHRPLYRAAIEDLLAKPGAMRDPEIRRIWREAHRAGGGTENRPLVAPPLPRLVQ